MNLVPLSSIYIPENSQRRTFDEKAHAELVQSIVDRGLLHCPCVRTENDLGLVAGRRRLRAIQSIHELGMPLVYEGQAVPDGMVPVTFYGTNEALAVEEAELYENIHRVDLTWQEKSDAVSRLHSLRKQLNPNHTIKETTKEVTRIADPKGNQITEVSVDVFLGEMMQKRPELAQISDKKVALKTARRLVKEEQMDALLQEHKDSGKTTVHNLHNADSLEWLRNCPAGRFDVVVTDPPYGMNMHLEESWDGEFHEYDDSPEYFRDRILAELPQLLCNVTKDKAHLYVFFDVRQFSEVRAAFVKVFGEDAVWPRPLIWWKGNIGGAPRPEHGPRNSYEAILYINKGDRRTVVLKPDVIHITQTTKTDHPAAKPVELYAELLSRSVLPGDEVLDCFCGSGPIFPAASQCHAVATGLEISQRYYKLAFESLKSTEK